jgi:hypothetical protein
MAMVYAKLLTYSAILSGPKNFCGWVPVKDIRHAQADFHLKDFLIGSHLLVTLFPLLVPRIYQSVGIRCSVPFQPPQYLFGYALLPVIILLKRMGYVTSSRETGRNNDQFHKD